MMSCGSLSWSSSSSSESTSDLDSSTRLPHHHQQEEGKRRRPRLQLPPRPRGRSKPAKEDMEVLDLADSSEEEEEDKDEVKVVNQEDEEVSHGQLSFAPSILRPSPPPRRRRPSRQQQHHHHRGVAKTHKKKPAGSAAPKATAEAAPKSASFFSSSSSSRSSTEAIAAATSTSAATAAATAAAAAPPRSTSSLSSPSSPFGPSSTDDDDDESDMDIPYTQNLGQGNTSKMVMWDDDDDDDGNDDKDMDGSNLRLRRPSHRRRLLRGGQKGREPLRVGDVIVYTNPHYVAGHPAGLRVAQVWKVADVDIEADCTRRRRPCGVPLVELSNGEVLPDDHLVRRSREYRRGKLRHHRGIFRPISHFRLEPEGAKEVGPRRKKKGGDLPGGFRCQADKLDQVLDGFRDEVLRSLQDAARVARAPNARSTEASDDGPRSQAEAASARGIEIGGNDSDGSCSSSASDSASLRNKNPAPRSWRPSSSLSSSTLSSSSEKDDDPRNYPQRSIPRMYPSRIRTLEQPGTFSKEPKGSGLPLGVLGGEGDAPPLLTKRNCRLRSSLQVPQVPVTSKSGTRCPATAATLPSPSRSRDAATEGGASRALMMFDHLRDSLQPAEDGEASLLSRPQEQSKPLLLEANGVPLGLSTLPTRAPETTTAVRKYSRKESDSDDSLPPSTGMGGDPTRRRSGSSPATCLAAHSSVNKLAPLLGPPVAETKHSATHSHDSTARPSMKSAKKLHGHSASPKTAESTSSSSQGAGRRTWNCSRQSQTRDTLFDYRSEDDLLSPPSSVAMSSRVAPTKKGGRKRQRAGASNDHRSIKAMKGRTTAASSAATVMENRTLQRQSVFRLGTIEKTAKHRAAGITFSGRLLDRSNDDENSNAENTRLNSAFLKLLPGIQCESRGSSRGSVASTIRTFSQKSASSNSAPRHREILSEAEEKEPASRSHSMADRLAPPHIIRAGASLSSTPGMMQLSVQRVPRTSSLEF